MSRFEKREPDAHALDPSLLRSEPFERREDPVDLFTREPVARVLHPNDDGVFAFAARDRDGARGPVVLDRVREEVEQHLAEAAAIGDDVCVRGLTQSHVERDSLRRRERLHELGRFAQHSGQPHRFDVEVKRIAFDPVEVEKIVDEVEQMPSGRQDLTD